MIDFSCKLYSVKSKKQLLKMLGIEKPQSTQSWVSENVYPCIDISETKKRLLEKPKHQLKKTQRRIHNYLSEIHFPDYVFSGVKGKDRTYKCNAGKHVEGKFLFKIDLTAFFPSVSRDRVYHFFLNDLKNAPDIAKILANLTTIDLDRKNYDKIAEINLFLDSKGVGVRKHLGSGFPTSPILSYLVNHDMFSALKEHAEQHNYVMTVYVDDVVFSGKTRISKSFKRKVFEIVSKHHYIISKGKTRCYKPKKFKLVTGVIIDPDGRLSVKNNLRQKIMCELHSLKKEPLNIHSRQRLKGLVNSARYIDGGIFTGVRKYAYRKCDEESK
jgi:hypothetical protein